LDINPKIFREYDIRGIAGQDLDAATVEILGKAMGTYFAGRGKKDVVLGRDCRLSSPDFAAALTRGLLSAGRDVTDLGVVPTPVVYFAVFEGNRDAGVVVTGSHNPPEHNGFKMMAGTETLYGRNIQDIYGIIQGGRFVEGQGKRKDLDIVPLYRRHITDRIKLGGRLRAVVDAGNGTAGEVAVPLFRALGCEVDPLFCEMDGRFPNHHPDPTLPEAMEPLVRRVLETGADLGLAYDGDADRIGVVDDLGRLIWGDQLMVIFARDILPFYPGAAVISEVKASKVLYEEIEKLGGRPIMWKTGHSLIKKKIKDEGAVLAGEMSGHIFFADRYFGFDDAIYASARLLEILSTSGRRLSNMLADLPRTFATPEIRIYASDEVKFRIVDEVRRELAHGHEVIDIDGVRAIFPEGWGLVRASNTQAVIVLRFEADTPEALDKIQKEVRGVLGRVLQRLERS
jgi:phosphomannomutase/phosphoglucomutase